MSARIFHSSARRVLTRPRQRVLVGSCLGFSVGTGLNLYSSPRIRFDSPAVSSLHHQQAPFSTPSPAFSNAPQNDKKEEFLSPELMKQLSGGSVTGFLSGVLVSVFSRTLVLLLGLGVVVVQVWFSRSRSRSLSPSFSSCIPFFFNSQFYSLTKI